MSNDTPTTATSAGMPSVDYSDAGTLRSGIEQAISLIDGAILMDDEPMPAHIEARMAAIRRVLRGALVVVDSDDDDDDAELPVPSGFQDRQRWSFTIKSIHGDTALVSGWSEQGAPVEVHLPIALFTGMTLREGADIVVRLVDSGDFWVTEASDAVPPRNQTNPALHCRDPRILARLLNGIWRTREETKPPARA